VRLFALVPAHNEELLIERCVRSLLASGAEEGIEVIVVADNCTDSTAAVASKAGAQVLVRTDAEHRGKGQALRCGFREAFARGASAVLVVDADSVVSSNLAPVVRQYLEAGSGAVQCRYRVMNQDSGVRSRLMDLAFLGFNVLRPLGRYKLGMSAGILGNGFALTREVLEAVPYVADSIVEDLEYHIHLVRAGYRVEFAEEASVFGEMPSGRGAASTQRARWEGGRLRMLLEWFPRLAGDLGRARMRCAEPLLELATAPLAYHVLLVAMLFGVAGSASFRYYALLQAAIVCLHVIAAASLSEAFPGNLTTLLAAPFYLIWKLTLIPRTLLASRPETRWVRTGRER
jgi:cellulose synthase/poly-beta-1,6-N-acetylglucosamine synthase-like glycosyltransferase